MAERARRRTRQLPHTPVKEHNVNWNRLGLNGTDVRIEDAPADDLARHMDTARDLGAGWARIGIDWAKAELKDGSPWWQGTDEKIDAALSRGITPMLLVVYDTNVIFARHPSRDDRLRRFGRWIEKVAQRYTGKVGAYEIWNEANLPRFWPIPDVQDYTDHLRIAYTAIKRYDTVPVISNGLAPAADEDGCIAPLTFIREMYARGAHHYFDGLGIHPYTFPALPKDKSPWSMWGQLPEIEAVMAAHGDADKQIWITEYGAPTKSDRGVGDQGLVDTIRQVFEVTDTPKFGPVFLYTLRDPGSDWADMEGHFGLFTDDWTPKAAASVVGQLSAAATTPPVPEPDGIDDLLVAVIHRLHKWSGCRCGIGT